MDDRLNLGSEVRELKLGSSFNGNNSRTSTSFHTLKYDFKPTSLDLSKVATLDVSSNNQVTVSVPHLDTSGVPKTVFKGNQRNYTKECVLIIDKVTGEITLEKLHTNIQVKKTRSESATKPPPQPLMMQRASLENSTQRTVSKTKVSTGVRKNAIGGFVQRHSPIQGSPSYNHHKSPQQAPAWNANNTQSTLPSIPLIGMDDDIVPTISAVPQPVSEQSSYQQQTQQHYQPPNQYQQPHHHSVQSTGMQNSQSLGNSSSASGSSNHNYHHNNHHQQQQQQQHHQPIQQHHQPIQQHHQPLQQQQHQPLQQQQQHQPLQQQQQHHHGEVGLLSSSDSSSDSDSSASSDSEDEKADNKNQTNHMNNMNSLPAHLLDEDLRLSESNSSDSDD